MKKFIVAVKSGTSYNYMFINVDDQNINDMPYCFKIVSGTFFNQDMVNRMIGETRKNSEKSLHSTDDMVAVKNKAHMNPDILGIMLWDGQWQIYE